MKLHIHNRHLYLVHPRRNLVVLQKKIREGFSHIFLVTSSSLSSKRTTRAREIRSSSQTRRSFFPALWCFASILSSSSRTSAKNKLFALFLKKKARETIPRFRLNTTPIESNNTAGAAARCNCGGKRQKRF